MPQINIKLHPAQAEFVRNQATFRGFVGGIGSGKSWAGAYDLIRRAQPNCLYMAVAPTYVMMADSTLRSMTGIARDFNFLRSINKSNMTAVLGNGAEILFRSADAPDRLRGPNLSGIWLDEASLMDREVYEIGIGRLREGGKMGWLSATFTPKGKLHWTFEVFGARTPDTHLVRSRTLDNPFLPVTFDQTVRRQYTSAMASQELGGEFIDPIGRIFDPGWFHLVEVCPHADVRWVRYWDKAGTEGGGAFTVGVLMCRDRAGIFWVTDVVREQFSAGKRNALMLRTAEADKARYKNVAVWIEQEPGSAGVESADTSIRQLAGFIVKPDRVTGDKVTRAMPFAAQAEAGNVRVLRSHWTPAWLDEIGSFPDSKYKDQVDASAGAFAKLAEMRGMGAGCGVHSSPGGSVLDTMPSNVWK